MLNASVRWLSGQTNLLSGTQRSHLGSEVSDKEIDSHLERLCNSWRRTQPTGSSVTQTISARDIIELSTYLNLLDEQGNRKGALNKWSLTPRTYAILRSIEALEYMPQFRASFTDFHLPYDERTLPSFLPGNHEHGIRQSFLEIQKYFLDFDIKKIETNGIAEHFSLDVSGDSHFKHVRMLGQGSFG